MLATLTGGAMVPLVDPFEGDADVAAEPVAEDGTDELTDEVAADAEESLEDDDEATS